MCFSDGSRSYSEDLTTPTTPSDCDAASDIDHAMFADSNVKPSAFKNRQFFCGEMKPDSRSSALCLEAAAQVSLGRKVAQVERERQPLVSRNGARDVADGDRNHRACFPWQQKSKWQKSSGLRPPVPAKPAGSGESNINIPSPPPPMPQILSSPVQVGVGCGGFRPEGVKRWGKPAVSDPPSPTWVDSPKHKVEVGVGREEFRPEGVKRWGKSAVSDPPSPTRVNSLKAKLGMREGRENMWEGQENMQPVALPGMSDLYKDEPVVNVKPNVYKKSALKVRLPLRKIEANDQQCRINVNLQVSPIPLPQNASFAPRHLKRSVKKLNISNPHDSIPSATPPVTLPKPPTPSDSSNSNPRKLFKSSTPDLMLESPSQSLPNLWLQNLPKWNAQNREAQHCVVAQRRRSPSIEKQPLLPAPAPVKYNFKEQPLLPAPAPVKYNFKVKNRKVKPKVSLGFVRIGQMWVAQVRWRPPLFYFFLSSFCCIT